MLSPHMKERGVTLWAIGTPAIGCSAHGPARVSVLATLRCRESLGSSGYGTHDDEDEEGE